MTLAVILASNTGVVVAIVVFVVLDIFAVMFGLSFVRASRAQRAAAEGALPPPQGRVVAMSRRDFFRKSLITSLLVFGAEFGGASLAFMWPNLKGGFGSLINAGAVTDIRSTIASTNQPYYNGAGRFYVWDYGADYKGVDVAAGVDYAADGYVAEGLMAIYQRCAHLGCRVPFCQSSKWFECPCHGSKYNLAGEYELGPAPNGLQRFPVKIDNGNLLVDTGTLNPGPPRGTDTIHEPPQGPFCVAPG
jgi:cytochrome b6-f complex iron-sulfur subunit